MAWISDFLTNRRQRTRADGILSSWAKVSSGVPQGSVIGPLLFCTVLDSLSPLHDNTRMIKYADDVTILHFVRETGDESLQSEWDHVTSWSSRIGLPVNAAKCAVMDYVTKSGLTLPPVRVSPNASLPSVSSLRLLGVILSCDMRWHEHVNHVITKATKRLFVLRFMRKATCPSATILQAYDAFIRPLLLYCFSTFCNMPACLSRKLSRLEKRAFQLIGNTSSRTFQETAVTSCEKLFSHVAATPDHPLRECFLPTNRQDATHVLCAPLLQGQKG